MNDSVEDFENRGLFGHLRFGRGSLVRTPLHHHDKALNQKPETLTTGGDALRRRQTALLLVVLMLSGLSLHPKHVHLQRFSRLIQEILKEKASPVTDQDKDGIPDLHEELFSPLVNVSYRGDIVSILGLDPTNGSDNVSDHDRDGLNALMEYWPYTLDTCYSERKSLT